MTSTVADATRDLPPQIARVIEDVVQHAAEILGDTLRSVILFGSAAENRAAGHLGRQPSRRGHAVRPGACARARRPVLQRAHAAVRLSVMWLTRG